MGFLISIFYCRGQLLLAISYVHGSSLMTMFFLRLQVREEFNDQFIQLSCCGHSEKESQYPTTK
ncbi:hypothetical protein OnM2_05734 [Erysiphe neolycopersici]|uniref:Uncharacterized protein n=1 Tax=Erysiphe neolycopersici TaxID=212602 RepID=A0A420HSY5_9PEZI|nr:hypothetical protein OnM2_05734 [Erysiphe neolycopersici]